MNESSGKIQVGAVILAAGFSRRFGSENKLLSNFSGKKLIEIVCENAQECFDPIVVVTPPDDLELINIAEKFNFLSCVNNERVNGMGASIATGISVLDQLSSVVGAAIILGDMPKVTIETMRILRNRFEEMSRESIIRPTFEARPGNPVLFPKRFFAELMNLDGDQGAKEIIKSNSGFLTLVEVDDAGVLFDVDELSDLSGS